MGICPPKPSTLHANPLAPVCMLEQTLRQSSGAAGEQRPVPRAGWLLLLVPPYAQPGGEVAAAANQPRHWARQSTSPQAAAASVTCRRSGQPARGRIRADRCADR